VGNRPRFFFLGIDEEATGPEVTSGCDCFVTEDGGASVSTTLVAVVIGASPQLSAPALSAPLCCCWVLAIRFLAVSFSSLAAACAVAALIQQK
jgi:hypothetical protein